MFQCCDYIVEFEGQRAKRRTNGEKVMKWQWWWECKCMIVCLRINTIWKVFTQQRQHHNIKCKCIRNICFKRTTGLLNTDWICYLMENCFFLLLFSLSVLYFDDMQYCYSNSFSVCICYSVVSWFIIISTRCWYIKYELMPD